MSERVTDASAAIIAIAVIGIVVVLLVLAVGVFVVTARRHDRAVAQERSRARPASAIDPGDPTRRSRSRRRRPAGRSSWPRWRTSARPSSRRPRPVAPVPYVPPDPETIGVTRRQFFNRGIVALTVGRPRRLRRRRRGFLWPRAQGRLRRQDQRRQDRRPHLRHRAGKGFFYVPEARIVGHRVPGRGPAQGREGLRVGRARRHEERHRRALPEVPAPRLPRAAVRRVAVVRVPVPRLASTTGSARRRAARRRAAWTASPSRSAAAIVTVDTGTVFLGPADRHQHHRPGGRGSALHRRAGSDDLMFAVATWRRRPRPRRPSC